MLAGVRTLRNRLANLEAQFETHAPRHLDISLKPRGNRGSVGRPGPQGKKGPPGQVGPPGTKTLSMLRLLGIAPLCSRVILIVVLTSSLLVGDEGARGLPGPDGPPGDQGP